MVRLWAMPYKCTSGIVVVVVVVFRSERLQPMNFVEAPTDARNGGGDD